VKLHGFINPAPQEDSADITGTEKLKYFNVLIDDEGSGRTTSILPIMTAPKLISHEADARDDRPACFQNLDDLATMTYSVP
jgi:hypothetical protein